MAQSSHCFSTWHRNSAWRPIPTVGSKLVKSLGKLWYISCYHTCYDWWSLFTVPKLVKDSQFLFILFYFVSSCCTCYDWRSLNLWETLNFCFMLVLIPLFQFIPSVLFLLPGSVSPLCGSFSFTSRKRHDFVLAFLIRSMEISWFSWELFFS